MRVDEDADHDRVADGADHDGADEGADARLVDADRVGDRLVVGSEDVLRCVSYGLYDSAVMTEGDREGPDALGGGDELETRVGGRGEARVDVEVGLNLSEVYHDKDSVCVVCSRLNRSGRRATVAKVGNANGPDAQIQTHACRRTRRTMSFIMRNVLIAN